MVKYFAIYQGGCVKGFKKVVKNDCLLQKKKKKMGTEVAVQAFQEFKIQTKKV